MYADTHHTSPVTSPLYLTRKSKIQRETSSAKSHVKNHQNEIIRYAARKEKNEASTPH